jgi:hypothetical protein
MPRRFPPGRGFEALRPRPPPAGAGAARQTRPRAVPGLQRPCLLARGGAKTAARCGSSRWQVATVIAPNSKKASHGPPGM